jgi:predicted nucleic acid-binding protein
MTVPTVILDTNILVASGFNPKSHSAQIVEQVRCRQLRLVWTEQTRYEAELIIGKIPPLSWERISILFRLENCYCGALFPENFQHIPDKADIKFVALSDALEIRLKERKGKYPDRGNQRDLRKGNHRIVIKLLF